MKAKAVVARIEMKEIGLERPQDIVAQAEAEDVGIKRHDLIEPLGRQHGMPHAERAGAKTGDRTPRLERLARKLGAVECFQPVADRIGEHDQLLDAALIGERA